MTFKSLQLVSASVASLCLWAPQLASAAEAEPADKDQAIVVTAPRQEELARDKQKIATVLVNIQAIETIKKYPDFNSAEALGRIPGIAGSRRSANVR
jgi:hypothetical protein